MAVRTSTPPVALFDEEEEELVLEVKLAVDRETEEGESRWNESLAPVLKAGQFLGGLDAQHDQIYRLVFFSRCRGLELLHGNRLDVSIEEEDDEVVELFRIAQLAFCNTNSLFTTPSIFLTYSCLAASKTRCTEWQTWLRLDQQSSP